MKNIENIILSILALLVSLAASSANLPNVQVGIYTEYYENEPFPSKPYSEAEEFFRANEQAIIPQNPFRVTVLDIEMENDPQDPGYNTGMEDDPQDPGYNTGMEDDPQDPGKNAPVGDGVFTLTVLAASCGVFKLKKSKKSRYKAV